MTSAETSAQTDEFLTEEAAARFLKLSIRSLQKYRVSGLGPAYIRIGKRRLGYCRNDLLAFIAQRRFTSTSEEGARKAASSARGA
jgi:hypothetical protein